MAQATQSAVSASSRKSDLSSAGSNRSDDKAEGPQVGPAGARPLDFDMPVKSGLLTSASVPQPPQWQAQAKVLATSTTTTGSTVTTTTTATTTTTTTTANASNSFRTTTVLDLDGIPFIAIVPRRISSAQRFIDAIKANDQQAFDEALRTTRLNAAREARKKNDERLQPSIVLRKLNRVCVLEDDLGKHSMTPLMVAARHDSFHFLNLLIAAGANPNICTENSGTALMHTGSAACIGVLLNNRAQVNMERRPFGTALIRAACDPLREDALQRLLEGGANVNQMACSAQLAAEFERIVAYREKSEAQSAPTSAEHKVSALMAAACTGNVRNIERLIAASADLEHKGGPRGHTALLIAVAACQPQAVKALLAAKADVNAVGSDGATALALASSQGDSAMMQILIEAGAEVDRDAKA